MARQTISDRLTYALLSGIFGAAIGFVLAWLAGVHATRGAAAFAVDFRYWMMVSGAAFAIVGFLLGEHAGTVVGTVIKIIFEAERPRDNDVSGVILVLIVIAVGVWFWLSS